jgi:hypothetical protein
VATARDGKLGRSYQERLRSVCLKLWSKVSQRERPELRAEVGDGVNG